jgi:hypothetical protein
MRYLSKFYNLLRSSYLNNSKYSNNLRHFFRIFFERDVKLNHTPTIFGTLFKGSKWSDYKTFNINKSFIKLNLNFLLYSIFVILSLFIFLGRSKSEQYFGFLPMFSYFNFILGYIPIVMGDFLSEFILYLYILFLFTTKVFSYGIKYFSSNFVYSLIKPNPKIKKNTINGSGTVNFYTKVGFNNSLQYPNVISSYKVRFSKNLVKLNYYISINNFVNSVITTKATNLLKSSFKGKILCMVNNSTNLNAKRILISDELAYLNIGFTNIFTKKHF